MGPLEQARDGSAPGEGAPGSSRAGAVALALAGAALLSCWNPFAAPVGLAVGLASLLLGVRALRRRLGSRRVAAAAVAAGAAALVASGLVLVLTAGAVTGDLPGDPVVPGRTQAEAARLLDQEAARTRAARERARRELEEIRTAPVSPAPREEAGRASPPASGKGSAAPGGGHETE